MGAVRFREAEPSDAQTLRWTKHAAIDSIRTDEYTDDERRAWKPDSQAVPDFRRAIDSETFEVLVAETDGETAGYGVLNRPAERIDAVFVHPEHDRQGIATSLVKQLESRARMDGIDSVTLVSSLNAESFYDRLGYRTVGTDTRSIGGRDIQFVIMETEL